MTPRRSNSADRSSARSPATRWRARGLLWRSSNMNAPTIGAHEPRSTPRRRSRMEPSGPRRYSAWAAQRAAQEARDAGQAAASDAARAALAAAGAAFLHPLAKATQVRHILGSAAHAARALELSAGDDPTVGADHIAQSRILADPVVVDVLRRYPVAPRGGGRVGELIRQLDASLR